MKTEETKNFWSKGLGAKLYRKYAGGRFLKMHKKIAENIIKRGANDVLDIACGPGDFLLYLSHVAPNLKLTGSDVAPGMVKHASKKLNGKARIIESIGENQPFQANSFDVITIMMAFHHFPNRVQTLEKLKELLRTNGVLIIADVVAVSSFQKKLWNFLERVISVRGYTKHYMERDLEELAQSTGFALSAEHIDGMPKRYKICTLTRK